MTTVLSFLDLAGLEFSFQLKLALRQDRQFNLIRRRFLLFPFQENCALEEEPFFTLSRD